MMITDELTPRQIAECEDIDLSYRVWVLCHALDGVDHDALVTWARTQDAREYEANARHAVRAAYAAAVAAAHTAYLNAHREQLGELLALIEEAIA